MTRRKPAASPLTKFIAIGIPLVTFIAGNLVSGFNLATSVAKKEDLKDAAKISADYTDTRIRQANDYTDAKVQTMMLTVSEMKTDIKSSQAALTTQVENLVKAIDDLKTQTRERGRGRY